MTFLFRFCYYCGEGQQQPNDIEYFICSCGAKFIPPVTVKQPAISLINAIHNFQKIELTDEKAVQAAKRNKKKKK